MEVIWLALGFNHMKIQNYLKYCQQRVNVSLIKSLPKTNQEPRELHKAMQYSVLNGGKRIRAALIYASGEAFGANAVILNRVSAAVEMVHAYSLIHDDLPALDNDDLRRGKPTCHKVFGEATAILAGDALQCLAFEILASLDKKKVSPIIQLEMIRLLARAIGSKGMIGGEELDIKMVDKRVSHQKVETMFNLKTGCLLSASILLGALASNCDNKKILNNLAKVGECIGLAFQIHDDIIGIESDTKTLGKKQGADLELNKPSYPTLVGMKKAKQREKLLYQKSLNYLDKTGIDTDKLKAIIAYVIERNY